MRKFIVGVGAILTSVVSFLGEAFGLGPNPEAGIAALICGILYVLYESFKDVQAARDGFVQTGKWKDPAFYTGLAGAILVPLSANFDLSIPVVEITLILGALLGLIFNKFRKEGLSDNY